MIKQLKRKLRLAQHRAEIRWRDWMLKIKLAKDWRNHINQFDASRPAGPAEVIVSLTSYPPRFGTLHLTLQSLLLQSYDPKKVVLWIAHGDMAALTPEVLNLRQYGLVIEVCEDLRSYKKLIPALKKFPDSTIVTADDDIYYWPNWLKQLVDTAAEGNGREIIAHRIHRIRHTSDGLPQPYLTWEIESKNHDSCALNIATGNAGILYPPNIFPSETYDISAFKELCPTADDVWFYWMARLGGVTYRKVSLTNPIHDWQGTQASSLAINNVFDYKNDQQIAAMIARYGYVNTGIAADS